MTNKKELVSIFISKPKSFQQTLRKFCYILKLNFWKIDFVPYYRMELTKTFIFIFSRNLASLIPYMENKMVFAVRSDLGMTKGKVAAQCAHAAVNCYKKALVKTPGDILGYLRTFK